MGEEDGCRREMPVLKVTVLTGVQRWQIAGAQLGRRRAADFGLPQIATAMPLTLACGLGYQVFAATATRLARSGADSAEPFKLR